MTDPLRLASWAERPDGRFDPAPCERRVIAAALRFAECMDRAHRHLIGGKPIRMHGLSGPEGQALLDAFRRASAEEGS